VQLLHRRGPSRLPRSAPPEAHPLLICFAACPQDPLADGPVIHSAATRALQKGATLDAVVAMVAEVSPQLKAPLVLFTYFNPILRKGVDKFCQQIKEAGASGEGEGGARRRRRFVAGPCGRQERRRQGQRGRLHAEFRGLFNSSCSWRLCGT
jgi:hypothetical protein